MNLHPIDLAIIGAYLVLMVIVGAWVSRLAARNAESYFLAGKSLPWYVIGIAHGSSGVDVTGTMWFVMMFFIYGVKAVWLLWIWPLFNVVFRMVYLGTWVRRSNVLTGAEWMRTRFGGGAGGELAYLSIVVYAVVHVIGFLCYAFRGIAEFTKPFFPWDVPYEVYGTAMLLVTGLYCVVGGMYSVVMNDLIQFALLLVAAIGIAAIAIASTSPAQIAAAVPAGWDELFFSWNLNLDWSALMPALQDRIVNPITEGGDGYTLFALFVSMLFCRGVLVSMAGPTPNYAIQHVLSTRSPREAALENMVMAVVSLAPRFLLIAAITVLAIVFFSPDLAALVAKEGRNAKFEEILPQVLSRDYIPAGFRGVLIAALLAAFMSTFVSTVNSGAAYVVNDIYKRYINPHAPARRYVALGWITSSAVILLGIAFGFVTRDVHSVTRWITSSLIPAFVIPNVLKWHWWRFNGYGFFAGMVAGTVAALALLPLKSLPEVYIVFIILAVSAAASFGACLLTAPEPMKLLADFYRTVRPWGFWGPVAAAIRAEDPDFATNREFGRDLFNLAVGLVWQVSMVAGPIYLVIQKFDRAIIALGVFAATSLILKFTWYDTLGPGEMYTTPDGRAPR
ncbi:MAG TPA: sodium:solute symporter [Planctomycetes bacterium]|nr:sodium:solute symporter [Planctomycetota bacterium]